MARIVPADNLSRTSRTVSILTVAVFICLMLSSQNLYAGASFVSCCNSRGTCGISQGQTWVDTFNGTKYNCVCDSSGGTCSPANSSSGSSGSSTKRNSTKDFNHDVRMMIVEEVMGALLKDLFSPPDNSKNEQLRQQQEAAQLKAEQDKQKAFHQWKLMQSEAEARKNLEEQKKSEQGSRVLSQMQTIGSWNKIKPFSAGNPKLDLKSISQNTYPSPKDAVQQLMCSAYFSSLAKKAVDPEDMRFYAEQAQSVMSGERTYLECRIPQVSVQRMKEIKDTYKHMEDISNRIQDIDVRLTETEEKIAEAEQKKEEVLKTISELNARASAAKPEEKIEIDDLLRQAQNESQAIDQEIQQKKQEELGLQAIKEQEEKELYAIKTQWIANR